tara:strand:+ start:24 stop:281 length:258 start_codon:yes stop_codon:yes gene_type:complete
MDYTIVEVLWVDAETIGDTGWLDLTEALESAKVPPPIMRTVGYVLVDTIDYIAITDSLGTKECGHVTKVPRSMIREYNEIRHMGQ